MLENRDAPTERGDYNELSFVYTVFPRADERETNQNNHSFDRNEDGIKAMFVVRDVDSVYQRDQKGEKKANAKGKAKHHKDAADGCDERAEKTPPIEMGMKIKNAHGTAELGPTMFAGEQNRCTN